MSDNNEILTGFINDVKPTQQFWALQDSESEGWVVLDSINFEETDVMPLWSTQEFAKTHCVEEWAAYTPVEITLAEWLEFWVEDLKEDNIVIGINWQEDGECLEVDLADFSQALAEVEVL